MYVWVKAWLCVWMLLHRRHGSGRACVVLTNPSDMNGRRQTGGFGSHGSGQGYYRECNFNPCFFSYYGTPPCTLVQYQFHHRIMMMNFAYKLEESRRASCVWNHETGLNVRFLGLLAFGLFLIPAVKVQHSLCRFFNTYLWAVLLSCVSTSPWIW